MIETNTKIGRIFDEVLQKIAAQTLTKDQVYKDIVAIERSRFNDVFLYVVNTLKELSEISRALPWFFRITNDLLNTTMGITWN